MQCAKKHTSDRPGRVIYNIGQIHLSIDVSDGQVTFLPINVSFGSACRFLRKCISPLSVLLDGAGRTCSTVAGLGSKQTNNNCRGNNKSCGDRRRRPSPADRSSLSLCSVSADRCIVQLSVSLSLFLLTAAPLPI